MRIAIVGSGISGLVAAHRLHAAHEITLFEAGQHVGGHTHTHALELDGRQLAVDTGFIVFNERTYPEFCALLRELRVPWQDSDMSFSVRCEASGFEYNGRNLDTLYAQRGNLLRPAFHRMLLDVLRFHREARELLAGTEDPDLRDWLAPRRYSGAFVERYLVPVSAAIWSASASDVLASPARFVFRFFDNHGMLQVDQRPQWLTVRGGSQRYVEALTRPFRQRIRLHTPVRSVRRAEGQVSLRLADGSEQVFDQLVLATHADQALQLLEDPSPAERSILGAMRYQENEAVLHQDARFLPRRRKCWASWNYHLLAQPAAGGARVALTYWMNKLQGLESERELLVTLNRTAEIEPSSILKRVRYHHPCFTRPAVAAQARRGEIQGQRRTWFCGAYWGFGFHEDGARSGGEVARALLQPQRAGAVA